MFVNTGFKKDRVGIIKKDGALQPLDDDDEDVYQTSLIDRYASRPPELEDMCLAEFAANYSTVSSHLMCYRVMNQRTIHHLLLRESNSIVD